MTRPYPRREPVDDSAVRGWIVDEPDSQNLRGHLALATKIGASVFRGFGGVVRAVDGAGIALVPWLMVVDFVVAEEQPCVGEGHELDVF